MEIHINSETLQKQIVLSPKEKTVTKALIATTALVILALAIVTIITGQLLILAGLTGAFLPLIVFSIVLLYRFHSLKKSLSKAQKTITEPRVTKQIETPPVLPKTPASVGTPTDFSKKTLLRPTLSQLPPLGPDAQLINENSTIGRAEEILSLVAKNITSQPTSIGKYYTVKNSNLTPIFCYQGSIETPCSLLLSSKINNIAIVNAANGTCYRGGIGTNQAISKAVTKKSWDSSSVPNLQEGSFSIGFWQYAQQSERDKYPIVTHLIQARGVEMRSNSHSIQQAIRILKKAYMGIFTACEANHINALQLPLLSTGAYSSDNPIWPICCKIAFLDAISSTQFHFLKQIVVIDYKTVPEFT